MRKTYDSKFKSCVALEAMRGELTIAEIASKYQVHPNQVQSWKKRLQEGATEIFMNASERKAENKKLYTEDDLMQKIGRMQRLCFSTWELRFVIYGKAPMPCSIPAIPVAATSPMILPSSSNE